MRSLTTFGLPISSLVRSQIAWETAGSFALKTGSIGLNFLAAVLLARLLDAEGYGVYAYAFALVALLTVPAQVGLPQLVLRETVRRMAQNRPDLVLGVWRWGGRFTAFLSLGLASVAGAVLWWSGEGLAGAYRPTLLWALLLAPLAALGNLSGAALRGLRRILEGQLTEFILRPGLFLVALTAAALVDREWMAFEAMALNVGAAALALAVGAWMLWRLTPTSVMSTSPSYDRRAWLASSLPLALIAAMGLVNRQTDILMLGWFVPPREVGIYRVSAQTAHLAAFGLQVVNAVLAPRFTEFYTRGEQDQLQRLVTVGARVTLVFNLGLSGIFLGGGHWLLPLLFGPAFDASYGPLAVLLAGQLFNALAGSVGLLLMMTGHEREMVRGLTVSAFMNVVLNLILIPSFGLYGAALATAISLATWNVILWLVVRRRLGLDCSALGLRS